MSQDEKKQPGALSNVVRALYYRNYRLFFMGQGVSLIGSWMQTIATSWLVYRLTDSAFLLGMVSFSSQIPCFFIAPLAGVLLDRWKRQNVLIVTQSVMMLQAFILALLTLTGKVAVWHVIILNTVMGIAAAFDMPGRQTFVNDVVDRKEDLGNAIALNSSLFNGARMIGPSIAGILIARVGEGMCFLFNAFSFIAVLIALAFIKTGEVNVQKEHSKLHTDLKEGIRYAFGFPPIRSILFLIFINSMMGMPAMVLLPIFTNKILKGGPETMGFLMAASGIGALGGAIFLASRKNALGLGRIIPLASTLFGIGLIAFSFSSSLWLSLILIVLTGLGMMVQMAASNTLLQTIVDEDKRGRIMSLYTTAFMGAAPLGSLMAGFLADRMGAPLTVMGGGICVLASAFYFARSLPRTRELLRPVYLRLGLLQEKAQDYGNQIDFDASAPHDLEPPLPSAPSAH